MRLLIVDDHELVRRCIRSLISDRTNYEICGEARERQSEVQLAGEAEALRKLNECSSRLWQIRNLHEGLGAILAAIIDLIAADKGSVQLLNPERITLKIEAQRGFGDDFVALFGEVSAADNSACARALGTHERIVIEDVNEEPSFAPFRQIAQDAGFRGVTSTPLISKGGVPLGILSTHFRLPHRPSDQQLQMLDLYVRQAGDFIERCRNEEVLRQNEEQLRTFSQTLDSEVRARTRELEQKNANLLEKSEQVRELSDELLHVQDEERRNIARELHDSAGQTLIVLGMALDQTVREGQGVAPNIVKRLEEVQSVVKQLHRDIRTTSYLLHPPLLDESGLASALRWYVKGLAERSSTAITLDVAENFGRLPRNLELAIFRVIQECLTNIHCHSGSKAALIQIAREDAAVCLKISDHGKGITPEHLDEIRSGRSGFGIRGMQERLRYFGGIVIVESNNCGTCVTANVPVPKEVASPLLKPVQAAA